MRALFDCDGVLGDFFTPALKVVHDLTGIHYVESDFDEWYIFRRIAKDTGEDVHTLERRVYDAWGDLGGAMEPYPEALEGVDACRRHGIEIFVVTSAAGWATTRNAWLAKHFAIPREHVVYTASKYVVGGDMFVDDHPGQVEQWQEHHPGGAAVLFARPYNRSAQCALRLDWEGIVDLAGQIALSAADSTRIRTGTSVS